MIGLPAFVAIALIGFALIGCRTVPVYNVTLAPVVAQSGPVRGAQVRGAILDALRDSEWSIVQESLWKILAKTLVHYRHRADIEIDYSSTHYSITYKDSENLLYDGTNIHKEYNKQVMSLQRKIDIYLDQI